MAAQPKNKDFDLTYHSELCSNYIERNPDPKMNYLPYFAGDFLAKPPYLEHSMWDYGDTLSRIVDALIVTKAVTGTSIDPKVEKALKQRVLSLVGEDGLIYRDETPWSKHEAFMWDQGRTMVMYCNWLALEGNEEIIPFVERMIDGLFKIGINENDYIYYPAENWTGSSWGTFVLAHPTDGMPTEGLVQYYELTGNERAVDLAQKQVKAILNKPPLTFAQDGSMVRKSGNEQELMSTHFHSRMTQALGILRLGIATSNKEYIDFAHKIFTWVLGWSSSFGWVPEALENGPDMKELGVDEVCCIMDVLNLADQFVRIGKTEYYDLIERFVRNQVFAQQYTDFDFLLPYVDTSIAMEDTAQRTYKDVLERSLGSFQGDVTPNEWLVTETMIPSVAPGGCCSPAGAKCLYFGWKNIVSTKDKELAIHMNLSHSDENVNITSHHPYKGLVELDILKSFNKVFVRIPGWVDRNKITLRENGKRRDYSWDKNYLVIQPVEKNAKIELEYPLRDAVIGETISNALFNVHWIGDSVISVNPRAKYIPVYRREEKLI